MFCWRLAWLAAAAAAVLVPARIIGAGALALACGWHTNRPACRLLTCAVDLAVFCTFGGTAMLCLKVAVEYGWFAAGDGHRPWHYFPVDAWLVAIRTGDLAAVEAGLNEDRRPDEIVVRYGGVPVPALAEAVDNAAMVKAMLERAPCRHTIATALLAAARRGCESAVRQLLAAGADPDCRAPLGETPLMLALVPWFDEAGHARCNAAAAIALLGAGCDTELTDNVGRTALMRCAAAGAVRGVELLLEAGAGATAGEEDPASTTALHLAAAAMCPEAVRALIAAGANPNTADEYNYTPIATAIIDCPRSSRVEPVLRALLAGGASVLIPDEDGDPLLHLAVLMGHTAQIVDCVAAATENQLAAAGAAGTVVNAQNETALADVLWRAAARPSPAIVPVLQCLLRRVPEIRAAFVGTYNEASLALARSGKCPAWSVSLTTEESALAALPVVAPLRWGLSPRTAVLWPAEARQRVRALVLCLNRLKAVPREMVMHVASLVGL